MSNDQKTRVDPDYALKQLMQALQSEGPSSQSRRRQWTKTLWSKMNGGPDEPPIIAETPDWVTPQVGRGDVVTGNHAAAGPLLDHEVARLAAIDAPDDATPRAILNSYFISQDGHGELAHMLRTGRYRIDVAEEAALLVVHWLLADGEIHRAQEILRAIAPFWDRLRFYPTPTDRDRRSTGAVSLETTADVVERLRRRRQSHQVAAMRETLTRWLPLYDRAVTLFLATVRGPVPTFARTGNGALARQENGQPVIVGGWPCQIFTKDWRARAGALLAEYDAQRETHRRSGKPDRPKENFFRLRSYLRMCVDDPRSLTGRDVGMIRKILASFVSSHGQPGTPRLNRVRRMQRRDAARIEPGAFAHLMADRIEGRGDAPAPLARELGPVTPYEAESSGLPVGATIPDDVRTEAKRCVEGSLDALIEAGVITSGEILAEVAPAIAAAAEADVIRSPSLRLLVEDTYTAFRRGRSVLPPGLEGQVLLTELPWVDVLQPWMTPDDPSRNIALETVRKLTLATIESFPHAAIPDTLVGELRTLFQAARLPLRLTGEPEADTFRGRFGANHLLSAKQAIPFISDTLYHRYYGLPLDAVASLDDVTPDLRFGGPVSPGFGEICSKLAGATDDTSWSVARVGSIIEQSQILTTHNLAQLVCGMRLTRDLPLTELASECFDWICRALVDIPEDRHHRLQTVREAAHAWRQMIFFLAIAPKGTTPEFLDWAVDHLARQPGDLPRRFAPAVRGLAIVAAGESLGSDGIHRSGARRFLGWPTDDHWVLARAASVPNAARTATGMSAR